MNIGANDDSEGSEVSQLLFCADPRESSASIFQKFSLHGTIMSINLKEGDQKLKITTRLRIWGIKLSRNIIAFSYLFFDKKAFMRNRRLP